jgi:ketosteroid isomerase-like protein
MGNKETFETISNAVVNKDFDTVRKYISDDFVMYEPPSLPYGGTYTGAEGFVAMTHKIREFYSVNVLQSKLTEAGDDMLVCEFLFEFTSGRTGEKCQTACVDLFRFYADGRLRHGDIYYAEPEKLAAIA